MYKTLVIIGVCAASFLVPTVADSQATFLTQNKNTIPGLKFVVSVEGKSFWVDNITPRNWADAGTYCASERLKLATVETRIQLDALAGATSTDFVGSYWTSGRDAQMLRQFSWNSTDTAISEDLEFSNVNAVVRSCLAYMVSLSDSFLYSESCSQPLHTMCETEKEQ